MSNASDLEQYMLELINAERAAVGVAPLAFNGDLNEAAEDHTAWMLATNTFSHGGAGGSSPGDRMATAGYQFTGSWTWGENIAWRSERGDPGYQDDVAALHQNLMNSSGHRANILSGNYREVGVGFMDGDYNGWDAAMVTQNFARSGSALFLTGVAYEDQDGDDFYDPGEGLDAILVSINGGGNTIQTMTTASGGYQAALTNGTYSVTFSSGGQTIGTHQVTIAGQNVKLDLVDPDVGGSGGATSGNDVLVGDAGANTIDGLGGDDSLYGIDGNDLLIGGAGADRLAGGNGADSLLGNDGADDLKGEAGNDWIDAGSNADVATGGGGNDSIIGGTGHDALNGNSGDDHLLGGAGNDRLYGANSTNSLGVDILDGGSGDDKLYADAGDIVDGGSGYDFLVARGPSGLDADLNAMSVEKALGSPHDDILDGSGVTGQRLYLRGMNGDDALIGGAMNDRLIGGDDDDFLSGGLARDVMVGGSGADLFANDASDGNFDIITDYRASQGDRIVDGASHVFNGTNTYVYDSAGTAIFRLNNYDADSDGILYA